MGDGFISPSDDIGVFDLDELWSTYGVEVVSLQDYFEAYQSMKIPDLRTCMRTIPRIMIHLIGSYGFYEGKQSKFRLDPRDIAEFLNIQSKM